jgi:hypothetical protein
MMFGCKAHALLAQFWPAAADAAPPGVLAAIAHPALVFGDLVLLARR